MDQSVGREAAKSKIANLMRGNTECREKRESGDFWFPGNSGIEGKVETGQEQLPFLTENLFGEWMRDRASFY